MQITKIACGFLTVCLSRTQIQRLLECVRERAQTHDLEDLELALESMLVIALISDDFRTHASVGCALARAEDV